MKKLRVFQNVYQRGTVQGFSWKNLGTVLLVMLFLPYIIASVSGKLSKSDTTISMATKEHLLTGNVIVRNQTELGIEDIPFEMYVTDKLARTMNEHYEKETLKAQAILIRTNLYKENQKVLSVEDPLYGKSHVTTKHYEAVAETKGMILQYENVPIYGAYFKSSNGSSRNANDFLDAEKYPYLVSVPCNRDYLAENYQSKVAYSIDSFERLWKLIRKVSKEKVEKEAERFYKKESDGNIEYICDSAGYVIFFSYEGEWAKGEEVRYMYELDSAEFSVEKEKSDIIFNVTGEGHGLGMSQYTANEMAKEGENYLNILKYFFDGVMLVKIDV